MGILNDELSNDSAYADFDTLDLPDLEVAYDDFPDFHPQQTKVNNY